MKHVEAGLVHWYHTAPAIIVDGNQLAHIHDIMFKNTIKCMFL